MTQDVESAVDDASLFSSWPPSVANAHLMGVGGSGMRALAEFLFDHGWSLSGSDREPGALSEWASSLGLRLLDDRNDASADHVICSAAVPLEARPQAALAYPRVLSELTRATSTVAVAGTHGKTTTSVLLALALGDVSRIVGGIAHHDGRSGCFRETAQSPIVVEACEFRRHFLDLRPKSVCILPVEWDHPDSYANEADVVSIFRQFIERYNDDPNSTGGAAVIAQSVVESVGTLSGWRMFSERPCDGYWPDAIRRVDSGCQFVLMDGQTLCGELTVPCLPQGQILNAVAAAAMALELGTPFRSIQGSLTAYRGVFRRFDVVKSGETVFVDDYAHHPTAVRQVLSEITQRWPDRPVVAVFEPHQLGRLRAFEAGFAAALSLADEVVVAPVFAAREVEPPKSALEALVRRLGNRATVCDNLDAVGGWLDTRLAKDPNVVVALLGAGKIGRILDDRLEHKRLAGAVLGHCPE